MFSKFIAKSRTKELQQQVQIKIMGQKIGRYFGSEHM